MRILKTRDYLEKLDISPVKLSDLDSIEPYDRNAQFNLEYLRNELSKFIDGNDKKNNKEFGRISIAYDKDLRDVKTEFVTTEEGDFFTVTLHVDGFLAKFDYMGNNVIERPEQNGITLLDKEKLNMLEKFGINPFGFEDYEEPDLCRFRFDSFLRFRDSFGLLLSKHIKQGCYVIRQMPSRKSVDGMLTCIYIPINDDDYSGAATGTKLFRNSLKAQAKQRVLRESEIFINLIYNLSLHDILEPIFLS